MFGSFQDEIWCTGTSSVDMGFMATKTRQPVTQLKKEFGICWCFFWASEKCIVCLVCIQTESVKLTLCAAHEARFGFPTAGTQTSYCSSFSIVERPSPHNPRCHHLLAICNRHMKGFQRPRANQTWSTIRNILRYGTTHRAEVYA